MTASRLLPFAALGGCALLGLLFAAANIGLVAPGALSLGALGEQERLVLTYAFLPRLAVSLLCGAALGLSGVIFQQVLQNPLASPTTLGVSAGAQVALTVALVASPALHAAYGELIAIGGAFAAWALVLVIAGRRRDDPMSLILTGFVVSYALGAVAMAMLMLDQEYLASLFIWGAGSLVQGDWEGVRFIALRFALGAAVAALFVRPLLLLGFGDAPASSLGVSLRLVRPLMLALAVFLAAITVAVVGVIGFVGLAAPHVATLLGAYRLSSRLVVAPLAGAFLLFAIDQALQFLMAERADLMPTGAVTALLGAPLLLLLLWKVPSFNPAALAEPGRAAPTRRPAATKRLLVLLPLLLAAAFCLALVIGNSPAGLSLTFDPTSPILEWRLPRVIAAAAAGFGLGVAGCLAQRLFANPMASPEVLGVGGGVAVGLVVTLLLSPVTSAATQLAGAAVGAFAVMGLVLAFGRGHGFSPQRLLLIGIAVTALFDAAVLVFLALGDPRAGQVLAWLSGSTYRVTGGLAATVAAVSLLGFAAAAPLARWLDILPLGSSVARGLGVPLRSVRLAVLVIASVTAAAAATVVGPLSFAGLIAPHIAAMLGLRRALPQLAGSALVGALLVLSADWIGRTVFAPTELPAGIVASLLGASLLAAFAAARRNA